METALHTILRATDRRSPHRRQLTINERLADGVHVALCRREGGFPIASAARARLLVAVDGVLAESGPSSARSVLLQAARALR